MILRSHGHGYDRCDGPARCARAHSYDLARIARDFCRQQSACSRLTPP